MSAVDKMNKLADRFLRKIVLGQPKPKVWAQAADVQDALQEAGVWGKLEDIFPLADKAGLPNGPATLTFTVNKNFDVTFHTVSQGATPAQQLTMSGLLRAKYAGPWKAALQAAKLQIADDPIDVRWFMLT
jgi:hypothetical protein